MSRSVHVMSLRIIRPPGVRRQTVLVHTAAPGVAVSTPGPGSRESRPPRGLNAGRERVQVFVIGPPAFVSQVSAAISEMAGHQVAGTAHDLTASSPTAALAEAQVVVIDAHAGGPLNGAHIARVIQRAHPQCTPLLVVPGATIDIARWLYREGAGLLSVITTRELTRPRQLEAALHSTARGLPWVQSDIKRVIEESGHTAEEHDDAGAPAYGASGRAAGWDRGITRRGA